MHLLVDARDGRQDRRSHRCERLRHARHVGDESHRRAAVARRLVRESAIAVGERQEEQHDVSGLVHALHDADRRGDEVPVREHAALRRPGRARGVDQGREVVLFDGLGLQMAGEASVGLELLEPVERDDLAKAGERCRESRRASASALRPRRTRAPPRSVRGCTRTPSPSSSDRARRRRRRST